MATITHDTLSWYGWDADGGGLHDVIGTRCDPYTNYLLNGVEYHHCCHSNLTRALAERLAIPAIEAEPHVHDVLNVFMCSGFRRDTHEYFLKASPVRPGDYLEFSIEGPDYYPMQDGLFVEWPYSVTDGHVTVGEAPGWGIEIHPEWLARSSYRMSEA